MTEEDKHYFIQPVIQGFADTKPALKPKVSVSPMVHGCSRVVSVTSKPICRTNGQEIGAAKESND